MKQSPIALLFIVVLFGCSEGTEEVVENLPEQDSIQENTFNIDKGDARIFTLPAPLQIPTALSNMDVKFDENLLAANDKATVYGNQLQKGENLGLSIIDLGYCAMNQQGQLCIDQLDHINTLADQLGVTSSFNSAIIQRFEENQDDVDSLSWLILDSYEKAHHYFRDNDKEDLGLAILSGCLIEGIYISSSYSQFSGEPQYYALFSQQKTYLENTIILLSRYIDTPDYNALRDNLKKIYGAFDGVESNATATNYTALKDGGEFKATVDNIFAVTSEVRAGIVAK